MNKPALSKKVHEILWNDWDPIGIKDHAPRDEYQRYVPQVLTLLLENKAQEDIALKLFQLETQQMGARGDRNRCLEIAKKLMTERDQISAQK